MKKTNLYLLVAVGALGVMALSTRLTAAAAECAMGGCCGGATTETLAADATAKPDLLETCPVSGEKLGEMGKPLVFTYKDQEVKLCCKGCKKDFDKDPEKYITKIRAADNKYSATAHQVCARRAENVFRAPFFAANHENNLCPNSFSGPAGNDWGNHVGGIRRHQRRGGHA